MNTNIYYHSQKVVLPIGTVGLKKVKIALPDTYRQIIGFGIATSSSGGEPHFRIGLRKNDDVILNDTHNVVTEINSSVAPKDKFLPATALIQEGNILYLIIGFEKATSREFVADVIFQTVNPKIYKAKSSNFPLATEHGEVVEMQDLEYAPH